MSLTFRTLVNIHFQKYIVFPLFTTGSFRVKRVTFILQMFFCLGSKPP